MATSIIKPGKIHPLLGGVTLPQRISRDALVLVQWLALVSMLVDHLGALSILGDWSRHVGRLALPAFVVMIACNALTTSRPGVMLSRCVLLWLLSQPLWWLTLGPFPGLNIMVTLSAVVALCWAWRLPPVHGFTVFVLVLFCFLAVSPLVEYSWVPLVLLPLVLVPCLFTLLLALSWPFVQYFGAPGFQASALVCLVLLLLLVLLRFPFNVPRLPRVVTRWFYPGHLLVLLFLKMV